MKAGLATSVTLHAVLLGVGLFSLSAPRAFEVNDVEALPVDIIPVSSLTEVQEGEEQAPVAPRPAPTPTLRPDVVEEARQVGEAETDMETPPTPEPEPKPVESASEPKPADPPPPVPAERPAEETRVAEAEETPVPAAEREPVSQPRQEAEPDPAPEPLVSENTESETVQLPPSAPVPDARPQPPEPKIAKAPEREKADEPAARQTRAQEEPQERDEELLDEVAALLNKEEPSGGGVARSTEEAALGARQNTAGETLTQSEMDALRRQIQKCWNVPAGAVDAESLKVSLKFRLDPGGAVDGNPQILEGGSGGIARAAAQSARRAILQCAPYNLPAEKYSAWSDVIVHFDPTDMF